MTLSELKASALQSTTFRGHKMGPWNDFLAVSRCACKVCGMEVSVTPNPAANDIDIGGPAVALTCKPRAKKYVETTWALRSYDVWGNPRDGYEVNNVFSDGEVSLRLLVQVNNIGTSSEFESAYPSDSQIRRAMGLRRYAIDTDGDDITIYVNRARDGYPLGEMHCTSHESLSPIRPVSGK